ncbi:hypothetical protein DSO57_1025005 [Entomophthora muscae]|uniref:Uncharacterized protein n=1 Tax=Entomophthora muscae TaxID=34485 RepID=A0ACC2SRP7_9FUNG|nr:hypothetical protein DSO57_1025005 [Entomophthora muscae]
MMTFSAPSTWSWFLLSFLSFFHEKSTVWNIVYTFSIYLEAVAILPQLFMLTRKGEADSITFHYLFALGAYRGLYIFNWIYRYYENSYYHPYTIMAGIVQTALFGDFFYIYVNKDKYLAAAIRLADDPNEGHSLDEIESGIPIDIPVSNEGGEGSPKSTAEDEGLLSNPDQVNTEELVYIIDNDSLISDMSAEDATPKVEPYITESTKKAQDPAESTCSLGSTSYGTINDNPISTSEQPDPSPPVYEDISHSHEWDDFKSCLNDPESASLNDQGSEKPAGNPKERASDV